MCYKYSYLVKLWSEVFYFYIIPSHTSLTRSIREKNGPRLFFKVCLSGETGFCKLSMPVYGCMRERQCPGVIILTTVRILFVKQ